MTDVIAEIAAERRRQIEAEGWTPEHDDEHAKGELASAAAVYAYVSGRQAKGWGALGSCPHWWPWEALSFKPTGQRRNLVRAAALIVAEIERLDRAAAKGGA